MVVLNWRSAAEPSAVDSLARSGIGEPAWWHVMGYEGGPPRSLEQVERQFRRLAAMVHPDRGGDAEQMQRLIRARAQARIQLTF